MKPAPPLSGFLRDLSPDTQAKRARKAASPWRGQPAADTARARMSAVNYRKRAKAVTGGTP